MPIKRKILEDLEAINSLKTLAESYEEVSVTRMQKIKDSVLRTRDFLAELSDVYVDLRNNYQHQIKELIAKKKKEAIIKNVPSMLAKNGKSLIVYLSSNQKLYGSVTQKTFKLFVEGVKKEVNADLVIIGSAGKEMYVNAGINKAYEYFDLPDNNVKIEHVKSIIKKFLEYERVDVYHGRFGNVIRQNAIASNISGEIPFEAENPEQVVNKDQKFIFEPVLEKILNFFESHITASLFTQTVLENQLARLASRVNAMEEALIHIESESKKLNADKVRNKHSIQNKKTLETISGVALWS
jgi:ATP synthase F1 gamma subunit